MVLGSAYVLRELGVYVLCGFPYVAELEGRGAPCRTLESHSQTWERTGNRAVVMNYAGGLASAA